MKPTANPSKPKMGLTDMKEVLIRQRCQAKGIAIIAYGMGFRIVGPGVDVLIADFNCIQAVDLKPVKTDRGAYAGLS